MQNYIILVAVGLLGAVLGGCATGGYEFVKSGVSISQRTEDSNACWKFVVSEEGQKQQI